MAGLPVTTAARTAFDWEDFNAGAEYDGDQHRTDRAQYVKDLRRIPRFERQGWKHIRVIKEDHEYDVVDRIRRALISRGWRP